MFDFPTAPSNGQEYTPSGGPTYVWTNPVWTPKVVEGGGTPVDAYTKAESDARYEPFDSAYTKTETDVRYLQINNIKAAGVAAGLFPTDGTSQMGGKLLLVAPSTTRASINFPFNQNPTSPSTGDVWQNASGKLAGRFGGATVTFASLETANIWTAANTFNGTVTLSADPVADLQAATMRYVDQAVGGGMMGFFDYTFNPSAYTPPPIAGNFRMDNANQTLATHLYIHEQTAAGNDASLLLDQIEVGDKFLIQRKTDATQWQRYNITAITDAGTYWDFTVTWIEGGSALTSARTGIIVQKTGGGGAGVTDGDKGDIVVSASGATWMLDSGVVTAAARTVLDDTTVAAMRTTLGAAPLATTSTSAPSGGVDGDVWYQVT